MDGASINIWIAFGAGILSFLSPCVLPLYPSYLSYITGISVDQLKNDFSKKEIRNRALMHTLFFVIGFSIIFISLGFGASFLGNLFYESQDIVRKLGAVLIILMGLFITGWVKWNWLMKEKRFELKNKPTGYLGSTLIGVSFAAGWTPCVGPILAMILTLAASDPSQGIILLIAYSFGFAIPFFIMAFFISQTRWILRYSDKIMKIGGVILILIGLLLFTDQLSKITVYLTKWFGVSWF
ncbi:cytochrome c biogenesis CcdA family protein [Tepidibacillus sp. HK-1]|uniref:cytochrome c biogenesis CcdA family protein n=1 Tax=Tepidibacillus sp. HK-1 TaxID=1883407 RepID=UPI000852F917|nr:cytochrome c biogenesis protein CcdA [Tepidibacillus sp. HK-1]GBF11013.1 thiol:disulfide interchange protein precursor [Tepidibacillus sp. HK-1]